MTLNHQCTPYQSFKWAGLKPGMTDKKLT